MSDLGETCGDTNITTADLALIGAAVLDLVATSKFMRHASPVGTTDYTLPESIPQWVAWHFARWCGGREDISRDVLLRLVNESGWAAEVFSVKQEAAA